MKNYIDPFELGSVPVFNDDIINLQNQGLELAKASYFSNYGNSREGAVVSGCAVTDPGGGDLTTATGTVFLDGDFYLLDAVTTASPYYIIPGTDVIETRQFKDGGTKNVIEQRKATTSASIPVSGQYITINRVIDDHTRWIGFTEAGGSYTAGWSDNTDFPLQFRKSNGFIEWRGKMDWNVPALADIAIQNQTGFEDIYSGESSGGGSNITVYSEVVSELSGPNEEFSTIANMVFDGAGIDFDMNMSGGLDASGTMFISFKYSLDEF